jgi:DHA3 family tetracycline resistance protein-like MFS transporter
VPLHDFEQLDVRGGLERENLFSPLRHRDFRLLWSGMALSLLGDGVFLVAIAWQTYQLTDAPTGLGMVGFALTLPHVLLLLLGGVVSDRLSRRKILVVADILRGSVVGALAVLSITGTLTIPWMIVLVGFYGAGTAFFGPAFDAIVPDVVPKSLLAQANALDQLVRPTMLRLAGPAVGGWVIAAGGPGWAFAIDALSFLALALAAMFVSTNSTHGRDGTTVRDDVVSGFRFIKGRTWLWGTFGAAAVAYLLFMGPAEVLLPYVVKVSLKESAGVLGFIFAVGGIGSILAAIVVGSRALPRRSMLVMYAAWTASTIGIAIYGIANSAWQLMVASFVFNALEAIGTIIWATTKQKLVPAEMLGRVSSLDWFISIGLVPVSFALTGWVAGMVGVRATLVGAGVLASVVTVGALLLPGMREPEELMEGAEAEGLIDDLEALDSTRPDLSMYGTA